MVKIGVSGEEELVKRGLDIGLDSSPLLNSEDWSLDSGLPCICKPGSTLLNALHWYQSIA